MVNYIYLIYKSTLFFVKTASPTPGRPGLDFSHFSASTTTIKPFVSFGGKHDASAGHHMDSFGGNQVIDISTPSPLPLVASPVALLNQVPHRPGNYMKFSRIYVKLLSQEIKVA